MCNSCPALLVEKPPLNTDRQSLGLSDPRECTNRQDNTPQSAKGTITLQPSAECLVWHPLEVLPMCGACCDSVIRSRLTRVCCACCVCGARSTLALVCCACCGWGARPRMILACCALCGCGVRSKVILMWCALCGCGVRSKLILLCCAICGCGARSGLVLEFCACYGCGVRPRLVLVCCVFCGCGVRLRLIGHQGLPGTAKRARQTQACGRRACGWLLRNTHQKHTGTRMSRLGHVQEANRREKRAKMP